MEIASHRSVVTDELNVKNCELQLQSKVGFVLILNNGHRRLYLDLEMRRGRKVLSTGQYITN